MQPSSSVRYLAACLAAAAIAPAAMAQPPIAQDAASVEHFLAHAPKGTLRVRAIQGSANGTSLAGAPIAVTLYHNDATLKQLTAILDERGEATLSDIPVVLGVLPVVQIRHAGVTYQEPGELMDPQQRDTAIQVTVFDTTDQTPDWSVAMRHVLVKPAGPGLLSVSEMVLVESRADRTWVGINPDEKGKACTVRLSLPDGARKVQLESGFHGWCCTKFAAPELSVWMPLTPGKSTFQFSYEVPAAGPELSLAFSAAARTDHLMVFAREDGFTAAPLGSSAAEIQEGAGDHGKLIQAQGLDSGARAGVLLTGLHASAKTPMPRNKPLQWAALGAAGAIAAAATVWFLRRPGSAPKRSAVS